MQLCNEKERILPEKWWILYWKMMRFMLWRDGWHRGRREQKWWTLYSKQGILYSKRRILYSKWCIWQGGETESSIRKWRFSPWKWRLTPWEMMIWGDQMRPARVRCTTSESTSVHFHNVIYGMFLGGYSCGLIALSQCHIWYISWEIGGGFQRRRWGWSGAIGAGWRWIRSVCSQLCIKMDEFCMKNGWIL